MTTELFIESRPVDISTDLSSLLTFAIDDVKDFAIRQTAFSKTITIPGTANNNKLFGYIFEIGSANDHDPDSDNIGYNFNASKSARCIMFQDYLQTFKGTMRILQINKDRGNIEYEVALNGELTGLSVALSGAYLDQLDFSAYDHVYSVANILASWDNPGGSGYYYPLIDYGNYSVLKHDWEYKTFRPALYAKEYISKMFTAAGFRYESALFETARFEGLIIPHNYKTLTRPTSQTLAMSVDAPQTVIGTFVGDNQNVQFDTFSSSVFTPGGLNETFTYNQADTLTATFNFTFSGTYNANGTFITLRLKRNFVDVVTKVLLDVGPVTVPWTWTGSVTMIFTLGDYFEFFASVNDFAQPFNLVVNSATVTVDSANDVLVPVLLGDTVDVNSILPKNIKQIDFFTSIVKLFNLYVYESRFDDRLMYITPFPDFYPTDSSDSVDWTYKLNRDKTVKVIPMSELNSKFYDFKYRDDSDFFNDQYKKRYNQGYGSYTYDSQFEFASQTNTCELIFAATPLVGYATEDKIYSTIFKRNGTTEENIDSVLRILQTKKITGVTSWDIMNGATVLTSETEYGYAGHFDDPDNPQNDLNFGVLRELFFALASGDLTSTQFNIYWSSYMAEITDKDSKMLVGKFYLTPKDIFDLDFSRYVVLDNVLFRLNKITDYNTTIPSDCEVQLLRVINTIY